MYPWGSLASLPSLLGGVWASKNSLYKYTHTCACSYLHTLAHIHTYPKHLLFPTPSSSITGHEQWSFLLSISKDNYCPLILLQGIHSMSAH